MTAHWALLGVYSTINPIWRQTLFFHSIYPSLEVGLIAGIMGTAVGVVLGITAGIRWEGRSTSSASEEVTIATNTGCKFYHRCPHAMDRCLTSPPPLYAVDAQQVAACYLYDGQSGKSI